MYGCYLTARTPQLNQGMSGISPISGVNHESTWAKVLFKAQYITSSQITNLVVLNGHLPSLGICYVILIWMTAHESRGTSQPFVLLADSIAILELS
jgi:hypothetical protein